MSRIHQLLCHEMMVYDIFGGTYRMSGLRLTRMALTTETLAYLVLASVIMLTLDPQGYRIHTGLIVGLLMWQLLIFIFYALHILFLTMAAAVHRRHPFRYFATFATLGAFFITFVMGESIVAALPGSTYTQDIWPAAAIQCFSALALETIFMRYVRPQAMKELHALQDAPQPELAQVPSAAKVESNSAVPPDVLRIGPRAIRLDKVISINSEEHYLRVTLHNETIVHRARLADVIEPLPNDSGIQPHRSWWVAAHMKPKMLRKGSKAVIVLSNGGEVPVARARMQTVQEWIDLFG